LLSNSPAQPARICAAKAAQKGQGTPLVR